MNKIFLNNFPLATNQISVVDSKSQEATIIVGFDIPKTVLEIRRQVIKNVFDCLLTHDKISISAINLVYIIQAFGFSDTIELLKQNYFELLDDNGILFSVIKNKFQKKFETGAVTQDDAITWLERRLPEYNPRPNEINLTLLQVEKKIVAIESGNISKKVLAEVDYDLKNKNLTNSLVIKSEDRNFIENNDILKILRLLHINAGLVYASLINTNNLYIDGEVKSILSAKVSPIFKDKSKNSIELLKDITLKKGIPDLSELYLKNIISINDFISIVENSNGAKFRNWLLSHDYNQDAVIRDIMKNRPSLNNPIVKGLKFIITNGVGLVNPFAGILASTVESFIINKFLDGWHPNLFLDNTLKSEIDKRIEEDLKSKKEQQNVNRFPKIGRNDPCPCGSTKKYKKCCGKV